LIRESRLTKNKETKITLYTSFLVLYFLASSLSCQNMSQNNKSATTGSTANLTLWFVLIANKC